jgi:hypothetical protein
MRGGYCCDRLYQAGPLSPALGGGGLSGKGMAIIGIPRHVTQRSGNDCAIAAVAMVANLPYEKVAVLTPGPGRRGLPIPEVHRLVEAATGLAWWGPRYEWLTPISRLAVASPPMLVIARQPWRWRRLHCFVLQGGCVHDPNSPVAIRARESPRGHWRVLWSFRPKQPLGLLFVQQYRCPG